MCITRLLYLIFSFLILHVVAELRIDPLVETNVGLIRGLRADDGDYSMFMGIPFARVREENPFGEAIPREPFDDVFEAYDDSAICPQIEEFNNTITGSLDCLHLNIYVPDSASSTNRVPVLIWIYGGSFKVGFSGRYLYGPKYLVRHDIILVTINYRLGPYGFMCLDTPDVPGNQGFKDQLIAFKWIKDNIEAFGGDSDRITIFGESAGGISVDFHIMSPHEKLYDKVILQSGTHLVPQASTPVKNAPILLAKYLGHETDDLDDAISFLANLDTYYIIEAGAALGLEFRPCIEPLFDNGNTFITENWITAAVPKIKDIPVLIGFNSQEALSMLGRENAVFHENMLSNYLRVGLDTDDDSFPGMEKLIRQFYLGDESLSDTMRWEIIEMFSDFKFNHPTLRTVKKYLENGAGDIFQYVFSYSGERNFAKNRNNITVGEAAHADEIGYLFDISYMREPSTSDQLVIDQMTTMWTNFVKYGDPTPELTDIITTKWLPITQGSLHHYLDINSELRSGTSPFYSRMTFWDLFYKTNYHMQWIYPGEKVV